MVKNGRATSIRKRYIFKKCEKIIFFLKTIFLGFVRNDKKKNGGKNVGFSNSKKARIS